MLDIDRHGASREASRAVPTPFDPDNAVRTSARTSAFIFNPRRHRYSHDGDICKYRFWKAYLAEQWPLFSVFQCPLSASRRLRAYTHIYTRTCHFSLAHSLFLASSLPSSRSSGSSINRLAGSFVCQCMNVCVYVCSLTTVWRCRRWSLGGDFPFPLLACRSAKILISGSLGSWWADGCMSDGSDENERRWCREHWMTVWNENCSC